MSAGALPPGCSYVLAKVNQKLINTTMEDGSLQGLFLKEDGEMVRVVDLGSNGLFSSIGIHKRDVVIAIGGREIHTVKECEEALNQATRDVIPVLTYNVLRKAKSPLLVETTSNRAVIKNAGRSVKEKKPVFSDVYEIGRKVSNSYTVKQIITFLLCLYMQSYMLHLTVLFNALSVGIGSL